MSLVINTGKLKVFAKLTVLSICCGIVGSLAAQTTEPDYQFDFTPHDASAEAGEQSGILQVTVLPPQLHQPDDSGAQAVPVVMRLDAVLSTGQWLAGGDGRQAISEQATAEQATTEQVTTEKERFVLGKFNLFQNAGQAEQYRQWLDPETYSVFAESIARNEIDLASDREFYQQYDNIRLLGSIRYGVYFLLYTQFRTAESGELTTSIMPVRYVDDALVTAASLHADSHELYRMLVFGTLQRQLMNYMEERVKN